LFEKGAVLSEMGTPAVAVERTLVTKKAEILKQLAILNITESILLTSPLPAVPV
jgi:hypothetical protein